MDVSFWAYGKNGDERLLGRAELDGVPRKGERVMLADIDFTGHVWRAIWFRDLDGAWHVEVWLRRVLENEPEAAEQTLQEQTND